MRKTKYARQAENYTMGTFSLVVKQPWCEDDYSPPTSVEMKNDWGYTSAPHTTSWHGIWWSNGKTLTEKCMCYVLYFAAILQICASSQVFYTGIMDSNI